MNILIVEDETAAFENLAEMLLETDPNIRILGNTESIRRTVNWLESNKSPDLIFMDIQLSDGSAFSIFDILTVETPIIFTTAFDEYAIDAFKVNSIDYLLKPIKKDDLSRAIEKFRKWSKQDILEYITQLSHLSPAPKYKEIFLIPIKDTLQPLYLSDVAFIYTTEKKTTIHLRTGEIFPYTKTLEQIEVQLNPADFIRGNKQFILSRKSVKNITIWFDNRLLIKTEIEPPERIYISKNKAAEFKSWMAKDE